MKALSTDQNETNLITAQDLRAMVMTKEALFDRQKTSILNDLMSTMVRLATEQGAGGYAANLDPKFDPTLLSSVTKELTDLGYEVTTEPKTDGNLGSVLCLTIKW